MKKGEDVNFPCNKCFYNFTYNVAAIAYFIFLQFYRFLFLATLWVLLLAGMAK